MHTTYFVGIDEVGRGPLAGPVTVCACMVASDFDMKWFDGIRDSKKLSLKKREEWFAKAEALRESGAMRWAIVSKTADEIDSMGIAVAISAALGECLGELSCAPAATRVFLDGSLAAPARFTNQETIIKGDEKVPLIGIASIIAKVTRDRYMDELAAAPGADSRLVEYGFDKHKGYGTVAHIAAIKKHGPTDFHRRSFLKNILPF